MAGWRRVDHDNQDEKGQQKRSIALLRSEIGVFVCLTSRVQYLTYTNAVVRHTIDGRVLNMVTSNN